MSESGLDDAARQIADGNKSLEDTVREIRWWAVRMTFLVWILVTLSVAVLRYVLMDPFGGGSHAMQRYVINVALFPVAFSVPFGLVNYLQRASRLRSKLSTELQRRRRRGTETTNRNSDHPLIYDDPGR